MTWFKLAYRNVFRQKKRSFLLAGAIAFGMLAITLLNTLTGAMGNAVKTNFSSAMGGHVYMTGEVVSQRGYSNNLINRSDIVEQAIASLSTPVAEIKRRSSSRLQLSNGSAASNLQVQGIEIANEQQLFTRLNVMRGSLQALEEPGTIAIPMRQAKELGVNLGGTITVKGETMSGQQNLLKWKLVALFGDQSGFGRSNGYTSLASMNQMLNIDADNFQRVNLVLTDMADMHQATTELEQAFTRLASLKVEEQDTTFGPMRMMAQSGNSYIEDPWQDTRFEVTNLDDVTENVMSMVNGLDLVAKLIFAVMLVITLVGISNSYRMILLERIAEIGNMRAMGAQADNVFRLFLYEAIILAVMGIVTGLSLAIGASYVVEAITIEASRGPARLFTVANHLPMAISISGIAISSGLIMLMTVLAAFFPARAAANLDPAEALRSAT
jgi:putative ABC transport system permease protein